MKQHLFQLNLYGMLQSKCNMMGNSKWTENVALAPIYYVTTENDNSIFPHISQNLYWNVTM